jgi:hypothetical protein
VQRLCVLLPLVQQAQLQRNLVPSQLGRAGRLQQLLRQGKTRALARQVLPALLLLRLLGSGVFCQPRQQTLQDSA